MFPSQQLDNTGIGTVYSSRALAIISFTKSIAMVFPHWIVAGVALVANTKTELVC